MLSFGLHHAFAGLWPLVWHWGLQVGVIILCLGAEVVIAWFSASVPFVETWLKPLQHTLWLVAIGAAISLYSFSDGVKVEHARSVAQQKVLLKQVDDVVTDVLSAPANQPQEEKKGIKPKPPADRWDNPEN